jgi:hypothetical protein
MEHKANEEDKAFEVVKMALVASVRGYAPPVAVEFARKLLFSEVRPTFADLGSAAQGQAAARRLNGGMAPCQSASAQARPIYIKRVKKVAGGHHGGAWKVAYADFVTAMMAFFLVMWLVTAVSKEQRAAIFDYFKNPSMEPGKSVKPAPARWARAARARRRSTSAAASMRRSVATEDRQDRRDGDDSPAQADRLKTDDRRPRKRRELKRWRTKQLDALMQDLKEASPRARPASLSRTSCCWTSRRKACASRSSTHRTARCSTRQLTLKPYTTESSGSRAVPEDRCRTR